ncbi:reverse transcriptase domain-containing protein, partial [Rhizobium mayense]
YKSDISSFFDNIPRSRLIDQTNKLFKKPSLHRLIERSANCEISGGDAVINRIANDLGIKPGLGVRQGMPISPFFSNVILYPFDAKMAAKGFELVRYADDFIVFAKSKEECEVIDQFARTALADFGFSIPSLDADSKTRIAAPDEAIEFLGLSLEPTLANKYELKVGVKQIDKIKNNLGALKDIDQLSSKNLTVTDITSKIENRIAGYKAAYASASNISELDAIFAKARSDTLKSIYSAIFGQDAVKNLGIKQAMILGLQPYPLERSAGRKSRKRH